MRKLVVLSAGIVALVVVAVAPVGAGSGAHISVTPAEGPPGTPLQVEGNCGVLGPHEVFIGFVINENDVTLATTTSELDGSFSVDTHAPVIAPPIIVPGAGEIVALCDFPGSEPISTPFTLLDDVLTQEPPSTTTTTTTIAATVTTVTPAPAPLRVAPSFTG